MDGEACVYRADNSADSRLAVLYFDFDDLRYDRAVHWPYGDASAPVFRECGTPIGLFGREIENRTGVPGGFIESDLVDPRYFSAANIKNRIESYLQMLEQKRGAAA